MRAPLALSLSVFICALTVHAQALPASPGDSGDPMLVPVARPARQLRSWDEALSLLSQRSTDLRISTDELLRAQARSRIALGALFPQINANGQASFSLLPAPAGDAGGAATAALFGAVNYQVGTAAASLTLVDAQAWNALGTTRAGQDVARASLSDSRRRLVGGLANTLLGVVAQERVAELNRVGLLDALSRLKLAEQSEHQGAGTALDLARARQDVAAARAQVVSGDETLRQSRESLGLALGLPQEVGVTPEFQLNALVDQLPNGCRPVESVEWRPDLKAARSQEDVASHGLTDVWMQFIPTLQLKTAASLYHINGIGDLGIWNIQGILNVPIWDGGVRYGRLHDARALQDEAAQQRLSRERSATVELAQANRGIQVAQASREVAQAALGEAEKTDKLTRRSYEAGNGTSLELVTAASSLRQQQLTLALRDYDVVRARVAALLVLADCPEGIAR